MLLHCSIVHKSFIITFNFLFEIIVSTGKSIKKDFSVFTIDVSIEKLSAFANL